MRDARPCRDATATRGGDKQQPGAPPLSFPRAARSCLPLPLGGEGRVRGDAGATSSLWVRPRFSFDSACAPLRAVPSPLSSILSPGGGEESGKRGARPAPPVGERRRKEGALAPAASPRPLAGERRRLRQLARPAGAQHRRKRRGSLPPRGGRATSKGLARDWQRRGGLSAAWRPSRLGPLPLGEEVAPQARVRGAVGRR